MPRLTTTVDYAERDAAIAINTYTTVLRRPRVPDGPFGLQRRFALLGASPDGAGHSAPQPQAIVASQPARLIDCS